MDDDALIEHAGDLLWTVRECLRLRDLGRVFSTAHSALLTIDVDRLDRIISMKAATLYQPVTHESANKYVRKMDGQVALEGQNETPGQLTLAGGFNVTYLAERQGFEPWVPCGTPLFESGQFNHSCISPHNIILTDKDAQYLGKVS